MATHSGNGADDGRSMVRRAHALLQAITLAALVGGIWYLTGHGAAHADERLGRLPAPAASTLAGNPALPGRALCAAARVDPVSRLGGLIAGPDGCRAAADLQRVAGRLGAASPWRPDGFADRRVLLRPADRLLGRLARAPAVVLPADPLTAAPRALAVRASRGAAAARFTGHRVTRPAAAGGVSAVPVPERGAVTPAMHRAVTRSARERARTPRTDPARWGDRGSAVAPSWGATTTVASGNGKSAGLGAVQHDVTAPAAPPASSEAAAGEVPALLLRVSEPPVSPD